MVYNYVVFTCTYLGEVEHRMQDQGSANSQNSINYELLITTQL